MLERIRRTDDVDWHVDYASTTLEVVWNHLFFGGLGVSLMAQAVEDTDEAVVVLMIMKMMMRAMCRLSLSSSNSDQHLYLRRD